MISVIIPARENEAVISECLDSLAEQSLLPEEVIVVDDGSQDRTSEIVRQNYPHVILLREEESQGFAAACNRGVAAAKGEWIAILNADAVAHPSWLMEAMAVAEDWPQAGMIACRVLQASAEGKIDSLGLHVNRGGMTFLHERGKSDLPDEVLPLAEEVFAPAGSAALYRRSLISEVGFFAPDYFAYYEDVELGFRARFRGFTCVLAHRARVLHRHSYSAQKVALPKRYYLHRNRLRTLVGDLPLSWLFRDLPFLLAYDLAGIGRAIFQAELGQALAARRDFLRDLPADLARRKEFQKQRKISPAELRPWLFLQRRPLSPPPPATDADLPSSEEGKT